MKNIKLGACDWGLPGAGLFAPRIAADCGLDALSLRIGLYENDYPLTRPQLQRYYLEEQQKTGVEYCAIALNDFDNIPMHAREGTKEHGIVWDLLPRAVETAKALGVKIIQVPAFAESEIKTDEDRAMSAKALQYLCDAAGEAGLRVATENLMDKREFEALYQAVDRKNFFLYFDSQNYQLFRGYSETAILDALYPYMCDQLHVKDGTGAMSGGLLGTGDSGFADTMSWLGAHGYEGYILLENYYDQLPLRLQADDPYDLLREDVKILKEAVSKA
ncbi:sugar phosphate isomerase/epimerase [Intestinibacillus massiliensis]|nr:sugar phosphate isomerase/epimerase [Intestinibacillus massiliensis]